MELTNEEKFVVFAAMCLMVKGVKSLKDNLTEEQWDVASVLLDKVGSEVVFNS